MKHYLFSRRIAGAAIVLAACLGLPVQAASASVDASACHDPALSQPFLSWNDTNPYMLVPGETADNFDGGGWTLSGGASTTTTTLADGATGSVLDLPSGSTAESPVICVKSDYPSARTMVRNVTGGDSVRFFVSYAGKKTETEPKKTGDLHGKGTAWTLSDPLNVDPGKSDGWQLVRIILAAGGDHSEFQVYNLYVDPRMRG